MGTLEGKGVTLQRLRLSLVVKMKTMEQPSGSEARIDTLRVGKSRARKTRIRKKRRRPESAALDKGIGEQEGKTSGAMCRGVGGS